MRTKLLVFLVGMMLLGSVGARAAQVTLDNLRYSLSDDGSLTAELTICYELTSPALVIPDYVTYQGEEYKVVSIGESVFEDFTNLTSVTLPSNLISIGESAFYGCSGLTSIRCLAHVPPKISANTFDNSLFAKSLYIPVGSEAAYMAAADWGKFRYIIEDAGLSIAEHNQSNLINYTDGIITLSDGEMSAQVDVYTSDGKQAATSWIASGGSCDINYLPSGLYIVKVKAGEKMMSRKIVK